MNDQRQRAAILVELLLSIVLVGMLVAACFEGFSAGVRGTGEAAELIEASDLCNARIEQIRKLASLVAGTGGNPAHPVESPYLPALTDVSLTPYRGNIYLTESDYYNANGGDPNIPPSLLVFDPPTKADRITQIEDSGAGYYNVTVSLFWRRQSDRSFSVVTCFTAK